MDITTVVKTSVMAASLVLLSACSGSNEVYEQASTDNTSIGANGTGADGTGADGTNEIAPASADATTDAGSTTTDVNTESVDPLSEDSNIDLSNERAQFVTSACGTLPVSTTAAPGIDESAPGVMTLGQLVSGRIEPESTANTEHFWSIALEPGKYHLVVDTKSVDGSLSDLKLGIYDPQSPEIEDDILYFESEKTDYRARFHDYFTVKVARNMVVSIHGHYVPEDYIFSIFKNGTAVPSPLFSDCPVIEPLSIDSTEAFTLTQEQSSIDDRWYMLDLDARGYLLKSSGSCTDGESSQVQYEFIHVDQFGQSARFIQAGRIVEPAPAAIDSVTPLERTESGPAWIRIQNFDCELSMEFTLSPDS